MEWVGDSSVPCSYPLSFCGDQDQEALMKSVKLLQALAQYQNHLQEQPRKALVDILSEVRAHQLCGLGQHFPLQRHQGSLDESQEQHCSIEIQRCII